MRGFLLRFLGAILFVCCGLALFPRSAFAHNTGATSDSWGYTSVVGCSSCHTPSVGSAPTLVSFSGPGGTLTAATGMLAATGGAQGLYTITVNIGDRADAGINVTSTGGTLGLCASIAVGDACDLQSRTTSTETGLALTAPFSPQITHKAKHPKNGANLVTFSFDYTPTAAACSASLIIWINGVDGTGTQLNDHPAQFQYTITSSGTACASDGNPCTVDACNAAGTCAHTAGNAGTVCNPANPANACDVDDVCDGVTTGCTAKFKPDGTTCNDGNACTQTDTCQTGVCTGGNPVVCGAPGMCQLNGICNPATGVCGYPNKLDGSACNDANACTQTDTCLAGLCVGSNPVICPPPSDCHDAGTCDTTSGMCVYPPKADGTACDDGNACTTVDTCLSAVCTGGSPVVCPVPDACHDTGVCDTTSGVCSNPAKADGTACDDGNACTVSDTCQSGACTSGTPVVCTAQDECHDVGTCDTTAGTCSNPAKADGTACSIGTCESGVCTAPATGSGGAGGTGGSASSTGGAGGEGTGGAANGGGGESAGGGNEGGSTSSTSTASASGGNASSTSNTTGSGGGGGNGQTAEGSGCGCRTAGGDERDTGLAVTLLLMTAGLAARRRSRRAVTKI